MLSQAFDRAVYNDVYLNFSSTLDIRKLQKIHEEQKSIDMDKKCKNFKKTLNGEMDQIEIEMGKYF